MPIQLSVSTVNAATQRMSDWINAFSTAPGQGTEVELRLPRGPAVPVARAPEPG